MGPLTGALLATSHGGVATAQDISIGHVLLQMIVALGIVVGGIWGFSKVMGRRGRGRRPGLLGRSRAETDGLTVLSRQSVGKGKSIAVVRAGRQCFLVGIGDSGLTPLGELRRSPGTDSTPDEGTAAQAGMAVATGAVSAPGMELAPIELDGLDLPALALAGTGASSGPTMPPTMPPTMRTWLDALREATVRR